MAYKDTIGRLGIWSWMDSINYPEVTEFAQQVESMGYGALWVPEAVGRDPFVSLSVIAQATTSLHLATGIANLYPATRRVTGISCFKNSTHTHTLSTSS